MFQIYCKSQHTTVQGTYIIKMNKELNWEKLQTIYYLITAYYKRQTSIKCWTLIILICFTYSVLYIIIQKLTPQYYPIVSKYFTIIHIKNPRLSLADLQSFIQSTKKLLSKRMLSS